VIDAPPVFTPPLSDAELATSSGCAGVFNPDQLLTLALGIDPGDFSRVLADTTYSIVAPAQMQCEGEAPLTVGVRRKRSGGRQKVGFKLDMNAFVPGHEWYGLKKLSLENGVSEGDTEDGAEVRAYVGEYLAWRLMVLSGAISSRATFMALEVNGESLGVYVNVEQVDKRFLQERLGDDSGWLYKKSGGVNDGLKTNELGAGDNPFEGYFCFWASGNGCPLPSAEALATDLPARLNIAQFLRFGAVNALIGNTDGPLFKDNNYYFYDYASGPRAYIPWDLDTAMKDSPSVYSGGGGGGGTSSFDAVLFTHWRDDYTAMVDQLLDDHFTLAAIQAELDRVLLVAGAAFDQDPFVTGTAADAVTSLEQYWSGRLSDVRVEVP
jgi:spore coat protein CotH